MLWRKQHSEEPHNLYCSPNVIRMIKSRRIRGTGYVTCRGVMRRAYRVLGEKPEGKSPLGRSKC
jgi:hypothetical protein